MISNSCVIPSRRLPQAGQAVRQDEHRGEPLQASGGGAGLRNQGGEGLHQEGGLVRPVVVLDVVLRLNLVLILIVLIRPFFILILLILLEGFQKMSGHKTDTLLFPAKKKEKKRKKIGASNQVVPDRTDVYGSGKVIAQFKRQ